jgi:hypothetical protein
MFSLLRCKCSFDLLIAVSKCLDPALFSKDLLAVFRYDLLHSGVQPLVCILFSLRPCF